MTCVIGLLGKKGSGKDTFYEGVKEDFQRFAFGDALKELCSSLGIPLEYFHDADLKEAPLMMGMGMDAEFHKMFSTFGAEFERFEDAFDTLKNAQRYPSEVADIEARIIFNNLAHELVNQEGGEYVDNWFKRQWKMITGKPLPVFACTTPRRIMQILGTDVVRAAYDDMWINVKMPEGDVVVTDVRFPNEAKTVVDRGGKLVRIVNPRVESEDQHASEADADTIEVDDVIENKGTIKQLHNKAKRLVTRYKKEG